MRLFTLSSVCILLGFSSSFAQTNRIKEIENQYKTGLHKSFLHQVSPQIKSIDEIVFSLMNSETQVSSHNDLPELLPIDTTWSYGEQRLDEEVVFTPGFLSRQFVSGDTLTSYVYNNNSFTWSEDSLKWVFGSSRKHYVTTGHVDSLFVSFENGYNPGEPFTYQRIFPKEPAENASYEEFYVVFNWDTDQWQPLYRELIYRDDSGLDTLYKEYTFDVEAQGYQLSKETRKWIIEGSSKISSQYISYQQGLIVDRDTYEFGSGYSSFLEENFDSSGVLTEGYLEFTLIDDEERHIYTVDKEYDSETLTYVSQDSLHFIYEPNDSYTEAEGYARSDNGWVFDNAYSSYSSLHVSGDVLTDSILVFEVGYNEETESYERIRVSAKTIIEYEEGGNVLSRQEYDTHENELKMIFEYKYEYVKPGIGEENFGNGFSKHEILRRDLELDEMYQWVLTEVSYDDAIPRQGYLRSNYTFSPNGEIILGSIIKIDTLFDGRLMESRFEWSPEENDFMLVEYEVYDDALADQVFYQSSDRNFFMGEYSTTKRDFTAKKSYPGVFNDGPIFISQGDTVSVYISALNPDMTIPDVEVSNIPATASYNPETRHFFWIVDDTEPSPMTYKAIRGDKSVTVEVEFSSQSLSVNNEGEERPNEFELFQNYPNPFNPTTTIAYSINTPSEISLEVFNIAGQKVATLYEGLQQAGDFEVTFDAGSLSSGIYLYRLKSAGEVKIQKMALIK